MKKALSLLLVVLMLVGMLPMTVLNASAAETASETLALKANTGVLNGTDSISWTAGKVSFTAYKAGSSSAIRTSDSDHFRVYAKNDVEIAAPGNITKIAFTTTGTSYNDPMAKSAAGVGSASTDGTVVTVDITSPATTIKFAATAQIRLKSVEVTYEVAGGDTTECAHANTTQVDAVAATCTTPGFTAGVQCTDCEVYTEGHEVVAATGHAYGEWETVTAATCTEAGEEKKTCANCGDVQTQPVAALGHNYVEGTCTGCGNVAVMTQYELVTDATSLKAGDKLVFVGADADGAYSAMLAYVSGGNNLKAETINAPVDGKISLPDTSAAAIITLGGDSAGWTFFDGAYYLYSAGTTKSNHLKGTGDLKDDNTTAWTIAIDENGLATIVNVGNNAEDARNIIKFNYGNSPVLFANYASTYVTKVNPISIYRLADGSSEGGEGGSEACTHASKTTTTVDATCTDAGSTTVVCDDCGETISTEEIAALGHSYVNDVCERCGAEFEGEIDTPDATGRYELATSISAGDTVIIVSKDAGMELSSFSTTSTVYGLGTAYTDVPAGTMTWTVEEGTVAGSYAFKNADSNYLYWSSGNSLKANATKDAQASWNVSFDGNDVILVNAGTVDVARHISWNNSSPRFANYKDSSVADNAGYNTIQFYKYVSGEACAHIWSDWSETTAATCTDKGVETATCTLCGETKTQPIDALGHSFVYTETAITCANCDYSAAYTLSPIADAKAFTDENQVYYVKGIVTYVSGNKVYIEDATGALLVMFNGEDGSGIALGDEILVWDCLTTYNGLIETTYTLATEYLKVSEGNTLPSQTVTLAQLAADTTNEYLAERVVIKNLTIGTINTSGDTSLTDADGNSINIYKVSGLNDAINANDVVDVTAIVSTYNGYQLLVNPGTAAADVVEVEHHDEIVIETVTIAEAKAGTAGEYYQVEGVVTYVSGRNVYIQDATGGIVVYLTANAANTKVGDKIRAYGTLATYRGLIELSGVNETNTEFYEVLSSDNSVDAQVVTIADLLADSTNEYLAEKISLTDVYVSYCSYKSSKATYTLIDGDGNTIKIYQVAVASQEECIAGGSIVNVEAVVSTYDGYQLVTTNDKITVTGTCAHETTELVNAKDATCTEAGYTGDTMCTVCQNYTARGEEIAAGHTEETVAGYPATCTEDGLTDGVKCTVCGEFTTAQEVIPADHTMESVVTAPTCTEQGYTTNTCTVCGETETEDYIPALGHNYVDGTCTVCGTPEECAHSYEGVVADLTNSSSGKIVFTCSLCGESKEEALPSGDSHLRFKGANIALEADLTLNFELMPAILDAFSNVYVTYQREAEDGVLTDAVTVTEYTVNSSNGRYKYAFKGIAPCMMNDTIHATVYGTYMGVECSYSMTYSAATYCYNQYKKNNNYLSTLASDLLNYGAAHQLHRGYKTENLCNAAMTDEQKAFASTNTPSWESKLNLTYETIENPTESFKAAGLELTNAVEIRFEFTCADLEGVTLRVTLGDEETYIDSSEFEYIESKDRYYALFAGQSAMQMRECVYATVMRDGEAVSNTIQYSVETYAARTTTDNAKGTLLNLIKMMMYYGDSAVAYKNSLIA